MFHELVNCSVQCVCSTLYERQTSPWQCTKFTQSGRGFAAGHSRGGVAQIRKINAENGLHCKNKNDLATALLLEL